MVSPQTVFTYPFFTMKTYKYYFAVFIKKRTVDKSTETENA